VGGLEATDIEPSSPKDVTPGTAPPWDNSSFDVWGGVVASWGCDTPDSSRTARGQHPYLRKEQHYTIETIPRKVERYITGTILTADGREVRY
jgi:hypothetical protein